MFKNLRKLLSTEFMVVFVLGLVVVACVQLVGLFIEIRDIKTEAKVARAYLDKQNAPTAITPMHVPSHFPVKKSSKATAPVNKASSNTKLYIPLGSAEGQAMLQGTSVPAKSTNAGIDEASRSIVEIMVQREIRERRLADAEREQKNLVNAEFAKVVSRGVGNFLQQLTTPSSANSEANGGKHDCQKAGHAWVIGKSGETRCKYCGVYQGHE